MKTAICAVIKDEHLFLKEWIDWHLGLGFDAIHLFEDKGSKSHEEITKEYDNVFLRRYEDDRKVQELLSFDGSHRQFVLYNWFGDTYQTIYNWVAFIDLDEFFVFHNGYTLDKLCKEFTMYPAIIINWRMIGASGHINRPNTGVMQAYIEVVDFLKQDYGWCYKSFCNMKNWNKMKHLHLAYGAVNTNHNYDTYEILWDKVSLDHYFSKSWEDWCDRIFNRGGTLNGHRTLDLFFDINKSMQHLKKDLIDSVSDRKPVGTYWLDKNRTLIAGGNVKKIMRLNANQQRLIFDLGFHNGDTATHYLQKGCKVIGVECNEELVSEATEHFNSYIKNGSLIIENKCVYDKDNQQIDFFISKYKEWSSLYQKIAEREEESKKVSVESITLATLIKKYGCPYYCKIDIEGVDILALRSLEEIHEKPIYISCEVECLGKGEVVTEFPILEELRILGYNKFMIIDQNVNKTFRFEFDKHYDWKGYDETLSLLLDARKQHWDYGIWFDIYATK